MSLLIAILICWLLWKIGILTVKFIGLILLILLIGTLVHVLLWPAIILAILILGAGLFTN
ncbi:hypothetical protein [Limosilactobacillus caviae]|uniref:Small multidrug resistance protein n=1 Tax=Limosilactobacillus caviae TaxID=1769424 RepID=A0ABQ2C3F9_9LACO|nr:hypothetical protein [Limosilactobacillus caviae]MBC8744901.1 hypothetical protein [Lactobacillus sp. Marseille-P7033]MRH45940.1 hypothetical protein [Limosilactobacillus reuteri]MCD7123988.1 hypothetical protein [Limosilactobacillus caviae]NGC78972.1 hypothetical protein [Limosilactobacillus reuteri]GGI62881.1 hypothetical protein GCM10011459_07150 [Limosilactobacillus caviae]